MAAHSRRQPLPWRVRYFVGLLAAVTLLLLPCSVQREGLIAGATALVAGGLLLGLIGWSARHPIKLGLKLNLNVGTAFEVAAVVLLPGPIAVVVLGAGALLGELGTGARPLQQLFNLLLALLRALLGGLVWLVVLRLDAGRPVELLAGIAVAAVMSLTAVSLVHGIVAVQRGERPRLRFPFPQRDVLIVEVILNLSGVLAALVAAQQLWALALLVPPAVIGQVAMRGSRTVRQSEGRFRALVQHASDLIVLVDRTGVVRYVSPSIQPILGYAPEGVLGTSIFTKLLAADADLITRSAQERIGTSGASAGFEVRVLRADGTWCDLDATATWLLDDPNVNGIVVNAHDITERKRLAEQLAGQAFSDRLTGLPNRALVLDRLHQALAAVERRESGVAVLFIDLDHFKDVNDRLGHGAGDALLVAVGSRLAACLRGTDTVARFGGDEFLILLEGVTQLTDVEYVAGAVLAALRAPFRLAHGETAVGASIGIAAQWPGDEPTTPQALIQYADLALYVAKAKGKGRMVVFRRSMHARATADQGRSAS